jgi:hypothetical protein
MPISVRWLLAPLPVLAALGTADAQISGLAVYRTGGSPVGRVRSFAVSRPPSGVAISVHSGYCPVPPVVVYPPPVQPVVVFYRPPPIVIVPPWDRPRIDDNLAPPPLPPLPPVAGVPPRKIPERPAPRPEERRPAPEPPLPPVAREEGRAEYGWLIDLGREEFAAGEYGRAELRFRQATLAWPEGGDAYFLLAQARLARGMYREAVAAVEDGLRRKSRWPASAFQPLELYGDHVADYADHLDVLSAALARQPDDPVLLFLSGYVLWFDGRREEAADLFHRAASRGALRESVERFLAALPAVPLEFL